MGRLADVILEILGAAQCPICGNRLRHAEDCLCIDCLRGLIGENRRVCAACRQPALSCSCGLDDFSLFTEVGGRHWLSHCFYTGYDEENPELTTRLVYTAKQRNDRRLYRYIVSFLAADIRNLFGETDENPEAWICTFPPRSVGGYRKHGFDQGEEMARLLAKELEIPFRPMFVKRSGTEQKKAANTAERQQNMEKSLFIKPSQCEKGMKILLFDDIITTGSTMRHAAELLYENGAECVFPVSYARTMRDTEQHK